MANYPKSKGTRVESALAAYIQGELGVECLRRTQHGGGDRGDLRITGFPLMIECKAGVQLRLPKWRDEVARQCVNAAAPYGVLVWSPPGYGPKTISRWVAFDWPETCVGPWTSRGSTYTGPMTRLVTAAALVWARRPDEPILIPQADGSHARAVQLCTWVQAVQEQLAKPGASHT